MSAYQKLIAESIGRDEPEILRDVEDIMRDVIFHSTLDWQSRDQFIHGAKEAYEVYVYMGGELPA